MLHHLSWPTLEQRRRYFKLLMFFKLIYGLIEVPSIALTSCTCGHCYRYHTPPVRTEAYLHSFLPSAVKLWNNLPQSLIEIDNINDFKQELKCYLYSLSLVWFCVCILFQRFYTVTNKQKQSRTEWYSCLADSYMHTQLVEHALYRVWEYAHTRKFCKLSSGRDRLVLQQFELNILQ